MVGVEKGEHWVNIAHGRTVLVDQCGDWSDTVYYKYITMRLRGYGRRRRQFIEMKRAPIQYMPRERFLRSFMKVGAAGGPASRLEPGGGPSDQGSDSSTHRQQE